MVNVSRWKQHAKVFWRQPRLQVPLSAEQRYLKSPGTVRISMVSLFRIFKPVFFLNNPWNLLTSDHLHITSCPSWSQLELEERCFLRRGGGYGGSRGPSSFFGTCAFPPALSDFFSLGLNCYLRLQCTAMPNQDSNGHLWCNPQVRWFHWDWPVPKICQLGIRKPRPARRGLGDTSAWCRWVVVVEVQMA